VQDKLPSNSGATWSAAELQWIEAHELAWRTRKTTDKQQPKRDWDASARAFAEQFGRSRTVSAIRKAVETWSKAHPAKCNPAQWTAVQESWLAERVPADAHLANSYVRGIARAFEDEFNFERSPASIRYKIEFLRDRAHRACEESWLGCLKAE